MPTPNRTTATALVLGLTLAVAGCSKADQQKAQADTNATAQDVKATTQAAGQAVKADAQKLGQDIKAAGKDTGKDLKAIGKDPEVKKAANELKASLKDL